MPRRSLLLDQRASKVLFRRQRVVRSAAQGQVSDLVAAPAPERPQVVKLQAMGFPTTLPAGVDVGTTPRVAFEHFASNRRWDVPVTTGCSALARNLVGGRCRRWRQCRMRVAFLRFPRL